MKKQTSIQRTKAGASFAALVGSIFLILLTAHSLPAQGDPGFCGDLLRSAERALKQRKYNDAREYIEAALPLCPGHNAALRDVNKRIVQAIEKEKKAAEDNDDVSHNIARAMQVGRNSAILALRLHEYNYHAHIGNISAALAFREAIMAVPENEMLAVSDLEDNAPWFSAVSWSADGSYLASAAADSTVKVWDWNEKQVVATLKGHNGIVLAVEWSPNQKYIASASRDSTIIIWDWSTKQTIHTLKGHADWVWSVSWSPHDSTYLASGSKDGAVKVWKWAEGKVEHDFGGHSGGVHAVAWSPTAHYLASASADSTVKVWDWRTKDEIHTLTVHRAKVMTVAWSADGQRLASASANGTIRVWDLKEGKVLHRFTEHSNDVRSVAWSPLDEQRLASASSDGTVRIWDLRAGRSIDVLEEKDTRFWSVAWSPSGKRLAAASSECKVKVWDWAAPQAWLNLTGHSAAVKAVAWSPDSKHLASVSADSTIKVWNVAAARPKENRSFSGHSGAINAVAWSPDGQNLASASEDGTVKVWQLDRREAIDTIGESGTAPINAIAWSPDGQHLAYATSNGDIAIWDWRASEEMLYIDELRYEINAIAWSPDGQYLASASSDGTIKVWDWKAGRLLHSFRRDWHEVRSVAWSPDGQRLVSASADGSIRIWDWAAKRERLTFQGQSGEAWSACWSPDGHQVVSASRDSVLKVWDLAIQRPLFIFAGHAESVFSVAWSPDGRYLASASGDYSVKVWSVRPYLADKFAVYSPTDLLRQAGPRLRRADLDSLTSAEDMELAAELFEEAGREELTLEFYEKAAKQGGRQRASLLFKICDLSEKQDVPFDHARFDTFEEADDQIEIARFYRQRGQMELALVFYEKACQQRQNLSWLFDIFSISENLGRDFDHARFGSFSEAGENHDIAVFYQRRGDLENALKYFDKAFQQRQRHDWLFRIYRLSSQLNHKFDHARFDDFEEYYDQIEIARFYEQEKDSAQALVFYRRALASTPSSDLIIQVEQLSEQSGQPFNPEALPQEDAVACDALVGYYEYKEDWERAWGYAQKAHEKEPTNRRNAKVLELALLIGKQVDLAKESHEEDVLNTAARGLSQKKQWAAAERLYQHLLYHHSHHEYRQSLFLMQFRQGKDTFEELFANEAIENVRRHYGWFTRNATPASMLKDSVALISWYEKAINLGERLLLKTPQDKGLQSELSMRYNDIAWHCLFQGCYDEAERALEKGVKLDKDNLYLYTNIPFALLFQGRFEEAMREIDKWKDEPYAPERNLPTFRDIYLLDIERFEKAYAIPPERRADVEKIRAHLQGEPSPASSTD